MLEKKLYQKFEKNTKFEKKKEKNQQLTITFYNFSLNRLAFAHYMILSDSCNR